MEEVIEDFFGQQEEDTKKAYRKKIYSFMEYTIEKKMQQILIM